MVYNLIHFPPEISLFYRPLKKCNPYHGSEARFGREETRPCKCGGITQPIKNPPENHGSEACFGRGETCPCKCGGTTQPIKNPPENSWSRSSEVIAASEITLSLKARKLMPNTSMRHQRRSSYKITTPNLLLNR